MFGKANFNTYDGFDRWFQAAVCGFGGNYEDNESPTFHTRVDKSEYGTTTILNKAVEWLKRDNVTGASSGGRPWDCSSIHTAFNYYWKTEATTNPSYLCYLNHISTLVIKLRLLGAMLGEIWA